MSDDEKPTRDDPALLAVVFKCVCGAVLMEMYRPVGAQPTDIITCHVPVSLLLTCRACLQRRYEELARDHAPDTWPPSSSSVN